MTDYPPGTERPTDADMGRALEWARDNVPDHLPMRSGWIVVVERVEEHRVVGGDRRWVTDESGPGGLVMLVAKMVTRLRQRFGE